MIRREHQYAQIVKETGRTGIAGDFLAGVLGLTDCLATGPDGHAVPPERVQGEPGRQGGPHGDLYVFIYVEAHEFFQRRDNDIICRVPISFVQAALGDKIKVPTLNGDKKLQIPKGTQPGDVLYFNGEGIPSLRTGRRGDQIIQVDIKTPTHLSKKQEALLKEFAEVESGKLSKKLKNILKGGASQASN